MPKISPETIALIQVVANENQLWVAERIPGELLKLGIEVSKRSIQKSMTKVRETRSVGARIFAIIDVWDALTSDRVYRKKWTKQKTHDYI